MGKGKRFNAEFKIETIKLVTELGQDVNKVASDIGVHPNTIYKWIQLYQKDPQEPFVGSGHQKSADEELRKAKRRVADLEEEVAILKKAITIFTKPPK